MKPNFFLKKSNERFYQSVAGKLQRKHYLLDESNGKVGRNSCFHDIFDGKKQKKKLLQRKKSFETLRIFLRKKQIGIYHVFGDMGLEISKFWVVIKYAIFFSKTNADNEALSFHLKP